VTADELLELARRHEIEPPANAQDRVWRAMRRKTASSARRSPLLAFGSLAVACALVAAVLVVRRPHGLRAGDVLAQGAVQLPGDAELVVGVGTRATLERWDAHDVIVRVDAGTLLVHVEPRGTRGPFVVRTPRFAAKVVGTVFRVAVGSDGASSIAVAHGAVEITPDGQAPVLVQAREVWPKGAEAAPGHDELAALQGGPTLAVEDFTPPRPACTGSAETRLRCELAVAQSAPAREAENALYDAGSIAWHELHDVKRALTLWTTQRTRFPNGALRREVQASLIDAYVTTRDLPAAESEIERYLAAEPDDLRAAELHFVLATVLRQIDGSCKRASAELELALAHPSGAWVEQARDAQRGCARR